MRAIRASREQQAALQQLQAQQLGAAMHERPPGTAQRSSYGVPYPTAGGGPPEVAMLHVRFGASEPEQLHVPGSRWHWHFSSPHVSPSVAATDT